MVESVSDRILRMLKENSVDYKLFEHEPVYTSEQAAAVRKATPADGVKSLLFKSENGCILVLQRGDLKVDTKLLKKLEGVKNLALASPEEVKEVIGVEIGAVSPFGSKTPVKTYMSRAILEKEWIFTQAGTHTKTVHMRSKDLEKIVKPVFFWEIFYPTLAQS